MTLEDQDQDQEEEDGESPALSGSSLTRAERERLEKKVEQLAAAVRRREDARVRAARRRWEERVGEGPEEE